MNVFITGRAAADLLGIQRFIAADNPRRAATFIAELEQVCMVKLAAAPMMGPARDEISPGLRIFPYKGYVICYRIEGDTLHVVRVFHGSYDITRRF